MTHHSTFCTIASAERVTDRNGSAASPTLSAATPTATETTISCSTLNEIDPSVEPCRPRMLPGTRPVRKSHHPPEASPWLAAVSDTELLRPGWVSRPRPMPMETAISAVMANQSSVWPASRAAFPTCLRLAMLTMIAVTISGMTMTRSSPTNVEPMVASVEVSQFWSVPGTSSPSTNEPGTVPMARATRPRPMPTTRATRTWAAKGVRRRRESTEGTFREGGGTAGLRRRQPSEVIRPKSTTLRRVSHRVCTEWATPGRRGSSRSPVRTASPGSGPAGPARAWLV